MLVVSLGHVALCGRGVIRSVHVDGCRGFNVSERGRGQKTILSHEIVINSIIDIVFQALYISSQSLQQPGKEGGVARFFPPFYR